MSLRIYILLSLLGSAPLYAAEDDFFAKIRIGFDNVTNFINRLPLPAGESATPTEDHEGKKNNAQPPQGTNREAADPTLGPQPIPANLGGIENVIAAHLIVPASASDNNIMRGQGAGLAMSAGDFRKAITQTPLDLPNFQVILESLAKPFLDKPNQPNIIKNHPVLGPMMLAAKDGTLPVANFAAELGIRIGALDGCFVDGIPVAATQKAPAQPGPSAGAPPANGQTLPETGDGAAQPPLAPVAEIAGMPTKNCSKLPGDPLNPWKAEDKEVMAMMNVVALLDPKLKDRMDQQQRQKDQQGQQQGQPNPDPNQVANNDPAKNPGAGAGGQGAGNQGLNDQQRFLQQQQAAQSYNNAPPYNSTREPIEPPKQPQQLAAAPIPTFGEPKEMAISGQVMEGLRPQFMSEEQRAMYAERWNDLSKMAVEMGTNTIKRAQALQQSQIATLTPARAAVSTGLVVNRVNQRFNMLQGGRSVAEAIAAGPQAIRTPNGSAISTYANSGMSGTLPRVGRTASASSMASAAGNALSAEAPDRMAGMSEGRGSRRAMAPSRRAPASVAPASSLATKQRLKPKHFTDRYKGQGDV